MINVLNEGGEGSTQLFLPVRGRWEKEDQITQSLAVNLERKGKKKKERSHCEKLRPCFVPLKKRKKKEGGPKRPSLLSGVPSKKKGGKKGCDYLIDFLSHILLTFGELEGKRKEEKGGTRGHSEGGCSPKLLWP